MAWKQIKHIVYCSQYCSMTFDWIYFLNIIIIHSAQYPFVSLTDYYVVLSASYLVSYAIDHSVGFIFIFVSYWSLQEELSTLWTMAITTCYHAYFIGHDSWLCQRLIGNGHIMCGLAGLLFKLNIFLMQHWHCNKISLQQGTYMIGYKRNAPWNMQITTWFVS